MRGRMCFCSLTMPFCRTSFSEQRKKGNTIGIWVQREEVDFYYECNAQKIHSFEYFHWMLTANNGGRNDIYSATTQYMCVCARSSSIFFFNLTLDHVLFQFGFTAKSRAHFVISVRTGNGKAFFVYIFIIHSQRACVYAILSYLHYVYIYIRVRAIQISGIFIVWHLKLIFHFSTMLHIFICYNVISTLVQLVDAVAWK